MMIGVKTTKKELFLAVMNEVKLYVRQEVETFKIHSKIEGQEGSKILQNHVQKKSLY